MPLSNSNYVFPARMPPATNVVANCCMDRQPSADAIVSMRASRQARGGRAPSWNMFGSLIYFRSFKITRDRAGRVDSSPEGR